MHTVKTLVDFALSERKSEKKKTQFMLDRLHSRFVKVFEYMLSCGFWDFHFM